MRKAPTDAERALWLRLRHRQIDGLKFRRQVPIGPFIVDFFCRDAGLVIELDGSQHAEACAAYDRRRTVWLEGHGLRVLRFWNGDVLMRPTLVMDAIAAAIARKA
jgi:very-short-patch-repair endonuclease